MPQKTQKEQSERSGLGGGHFLFLCLLLTPPSLASYRAFSPTVAAWIGGWTAAVSLFTYLMYAWDKRRARDQQWREPESLLHVMELAGGWPGAFLAQRHLRHKSSKVSYQFIYWLIVLGYEFIAVDFLLGWPLGRMLRAAIG